MEIFVHLLLGHCLADYPLQGDFLANIKGKNTFLLMIHSAIWACIIWSILNYHGLASTFVEFFVLFIWHMVIDKWKCSRPDKTKALTTDLYIDQAAHATQILVSVFFI